MKLKHSESLVIVWRISEWEARYLNSSVIEPVHLLLGLCKIVDVDLAALVSKIAVGTDRDEILEEVLREVRRLRTAFQSANLDAQPFRRRLRAASLTKSQEISEMKNLRRNKAAKQVFADAEHYAAIEGSAVYPIHLLYAVLLADDSRASNVMVELGINRKRLQEVAKREVLHGPPTAFLSSKPSERRWN